MFADVNDGRLAFSRVSLLLRKKTYNLVQVENRTMELVAFEMISAHAYFTEITRMVLVKVNSVMMLPSGITATTGMFSRVKKCDV